MNVIATEKANLKKFASGQVEIAEPGVVPRAATSGKGIRIALVGQFGAGNFGNDGSLEAMVRMLRRQLPEAALSVVCTEPETVKRDFGIDAIRITRPPLQNRLLDLVNRALGRIPYKLVGPFRAYAKLKGFHAVVLPGTGAFDDFGDTPFGMPYVFLKWMAAARLRGLKVAFVSIGAGPAYNALSRFFFAVTTRCATYRTFRDGISREFVQSLGTDATQDRIFPDLAFELPVPEPLEPKRSDVMTIGLGVMNYKGRTANGQKIYADYIAKLVAFTHDTLRAGYRIRLMLGQDNDKIAVDDIQRLIRPMVTDEMYERLVFTPSSSLHDVMAQMLSTDVIVATRFHNVVCALRVGIPLISLGYLEKHDVLAADMGVAEYCTGVETFRVDWLERKLQDLIADRDRLAVQISSKVEVYRAALRAQEVIVADHIVG